MKKYAGICHECIHYLLLWLVVKDVWVFGCNSLLRTANTSHACHTFTWTGYFIHYGRTCCPFEPTALPAAQI